MKCSKMLKFGTTYCSAQVGNLNCQKCSFHVLHFEFRPDGRPLPSLESYDDRIHVIDRETQTQVPIKAKRVFELHKTLGHHKSPYSALRSSLQEITKKANQLSLVISMSPITRQGAQLAYSTVYLPMIKYTLPQSFFPRSLLDQAQSLSMARMIAKSGFNRNTARAIVFAPTSFAGGGFIPWYVLQGEGQVLHILKHTRTDSIVSRTLMIALEWAQWQSGHHESIFHDTQTDLPHLECRWLTSTRSFMASIGATFKFAKNLVFHKERTNDLFIMQYARECGLFTTKELIIINYCRIYLHVTTVSELFEPDGRTIISDLFNCRREPWFNSEAYLTLQTRSSAY